MTDMATWQFPPNSGGIDVIQDPSSFHFSDAPIANVVREVIQNSLDAREDGLDRVTVKFIEESVNPSLVGGYQLIHHLTQCLARARQEERPSIQAVYERALQTASRDSLRCLKIQDSGTTGLKDTKWDALVLQEGSVKKNSGTVVPGGSYGIGKNAVLNVSDLMTVFYSTRYVQGRKGRVEKLQGKATLMTHQNPQYGDAEPGRRYLQHIGFYRMPDQQPITGTREVPPFFKLDETGTAIFIIGFNPHSTEWAKDLKSAVISNFFHAIHHDRLRVVVRPLDEPESTITFHTIDMDFEALIPDSAAYHYYQTVRGDQRTHRVTTAGEGEIGPVDLHVRIGAGPRRTAYINRNGMLVTDSKEQRINPLAPRGRNVWPDYTAVVMPRTDAGANFLLRMENPNHSSLSPSQFADQDTEQRASESLRATRQAIRNTIDSMVASVPQDDITNAGELIQQLPELAASQAGPQALPTRTIHGPLKALLSEPMVPEYEESPLASPGESSHDAPSTLPVIVKIDNPRVIPTGEREAVLAFTLPEQPPQEIALVLRPAGEEPMRQNQIPIVEAKAMVPAGLSLSTDQGVLYINPIAHGRVTIRVSTGDDIENVAVNLDGR